MTRDQALRMIEDEFTAARKADAAGNDGMVRVCARRAAGFAIGCWLDGRPQAGWTADAVGRLRSVEADETFPDLVRQAAHRLTARVKEDFSPQYANDPLDDARKVIAHFLQEGTTP